MLANGKSLSLNIVSTEEQSDWNATGGRRFILNKPTNTSDFINDGEDGSSPYVTQDELNNSLAIQDLDEVLGEGNQAPYKGAYIEEIGLWDDFSAPFGYAKIYADKAKVWFRSKLGNNMFNITENGWAHIKGIFTFTFSFQTITGNRTVTFKNESGVVAYMNDIPGQYTLIEYADNATAIAAGLPIGRLYRTGDVVKVVH